MNLSETHAKLKSALEPLGIEVGPELLTIWADRAAHGREPLPARALERLRDVAEQLAAAHTP